MVTAAPPSANLHAFGRAHTVLVVDDDDDLRELMRHALELNGYSVATARDGHHALRVLEDMGPPCVIMLDLVMEGMNGWDFFEKVRELPDLASVPVIVHSSAAWRAPAGATRLLPKPISLDRLLGAVSEFCTVRAEG